jgi:hypothetical protein
LAAQASLQRVSLNWGYEALRDLARRGVLRRLCLVGLLRRAFFLAAGVFVATGKATDAAEIDGKNVSVPMKVSEATISSAKREIFFKLRSIPEGLERDPNAQCTLAG